MYLGASTIVKIYPFILSLTSVHLPTTKLLQHFLRHFPILPIKYTSLGRARRCLNFFLSVLLHKYRAMPLTLKANHA